MKEQIFAALEKQREKLISMADFIYDHPECRGNEVQASALLTDYLEENGFLVERGIADFPTAFRAVYENGSGGPSIGILCEYDALEKIGHGCGHHMQGPSCIGAALALKEVYQERPYKLVIYGTPAEETLGSKSLMLERGCFRDIDVALMMHGSPTTCTDVKSMADIHFDVKFRGKSAHAAMAPEKGRSAFDALLVAFHGIEFLREHVPEDIRMHYTVTTLPGPANVVPAEASGQFSLRSYSRERLDSQVIPRFYDIIKGAALIAGVEYEIHRDKYLFNKIPVLKLNELLMKNAELVNAPRLAPPREKTGSTDFGNVMYEVPGSCIRVAFVPSGAVAHSQEYVDAGKTQEAHDCILYGAKIIAASCYDMISRPELLQEIQTEFRENRKNFA